MCLKYLDGSHWDKKKMDWVVESRAFPITLCSPPPHIPIKEFGKNSNKWNHMIVSSQPSGFVLPRSFSEDLIKEGRGPGTWEENACRGDRRGEQGMTHRVVMCPLCAGRSVCRPQHMEKECKYFWWQVVWLHGNSFSDLSKKINHQIIGEAIPWCVCF